MSVVSCSTTTTTAYKVTADTTGTLVLQTGSGPTTAVTIDGSQNVGVGVTPIAWVSSAKALQIGSVGAVVTDGTAVTFKNNTYKNTGGTDVYLTTGYASQYYQYQSTHVWNTAPSGTAGNAITFTQAMTLDASGNLLVGTTSNPNTARMYVRYDGVTTQSVVNSVSTTSASTSWSHFIGQSGNGSSITTNNIFIRGNGNLENANNSYGAISDVKLKENITDATPKLDKLLQVKVRNYNLKGDYEQHKQIGVIAQELEQVFPGMVEESPDFEIVTTTDEKGNETSERVAIGTTTKSVKYSVFVPMLIKALQEQQALITQLQADVAALKG